MENEPLEPAVLAVELFKQEDRHRRRSSTLAVVGVLCAVVGGGAVFAAFKYAPEWFQSDPTPLVVNNGGVQPPLNNPAKLYTEPVDPPVSDPLKPEDKPEVKPEDTPKPPTGESGPTTISPFNPLNGAIINDTPVPDGWKPGDPVPSGPGAPQLNPEGPAAKPVEANLITARVGGGDPEGEANEVAAALRSLGASVRLAPHYSLAGGVVGVNLIATVPTKSVDSLMKKLGGGDNWKGPVSDRNDRATGMLASRIKELESRESQLKEKYEEDATEVSVVKEEIQKLNQGLSMVRAAKSPGVAVILIGIGSL